MIILHLIISAAILNRVILFFGNKRVHVLLDNMQMLVGPVLVVVKNANLAMVLVLINVMNVPKADILMEQNVSNVTPLVPSVLGLGIISAQFVHLVLPYLMVFVLKQVDVPHLLL